MEKNKKNLYERYFKRSIGVVLSFCGLIILLVPMLIISVLIKIESKGPIIFKQKRLGKNQKYITVYKFRTMCNNAYQLGGIVKNEKDSRITKVGAILRKTSLDELPQMINVIKGDMAIIGPRPILDWEFANYANNKVYMRRYSALPGMFCTVDVDYRAKASRELQFTMDAEYVMNISLKNDTKIFLKIIESVVKRKNVYKA